MRTTNIDRHDVGMSFLASEYCQDMCKYFSHDFFLTFYELKSVSVPTSIVSYYEKLFNNKLHLCSISLNAHISDCI